MEEVFFKSTLPARDSAVLRDSSLALPAEPVPRSSGKANPVDRNLRVHQQVQLTLARRAKKSPCHGGVHLQKNASKSFDAADGLSPSAKANGFGFSYRCHSSNHIQKPSKRVEVSPPVSPEFPQRPINRGTLRYATYTHPGPSQPGHRPAAVPDRSFGSESFRRYAFSEAPRVTRPLPSTAATFEGFGRRSLRQSGSPRPLMANSTFQRSRDYGSRRNHFQSFAQERKQNKETMFGAAPPDGDDDDDGGLTWLARVRREGRGHGRPASQPPSIASMEVDMGRRVEVDLPVQPIQTQTVRTVKSANKPPEMTIERAVSLLTQDNEDTLISAAAHIQSQCYKSADAKKIVYYLRGIGKLLQLIRSDNEDVQRVAAGALRNVVYQSSENKMEVKENDGLATILDVLKSSRDKETIRELTGLLWNLSSHDLLKERLSREALAVLTKAVLVPSSGISEGENPKDELVADADAFHNATGCLRNLSSAGPDGRKAMRECENLIDSLVYYIRGAIADYKTDDKSTENCVCILHNLSYQIDAELPKMPARDLRESRQTLAPKPKAVGCFSYRSAKLTEQLERRCPLLEEKANPRGIEWLWSAITVRMYLSLLARSVRHCTQEAAIGALQNITAGRGLINEAITFTIVQRENGLLHVKKMLEEGESDVRRTAVSLIRNLSRFHELHPDIVKQVLPEVVGMLPHDDTGTDLPTEVTATLCQILNNLSQTDKQHVRAIVNEGALPKLISISSKDNGYGPSKAGQAACQLLHTMWSYSDLHGAYRKCGYRKSDFVNVRTQKAVNSG